MSAINNTGHMVVSSALLEVVAGLAVICRADETTTFEATAKTLVIEWSGKIALAIRRTKQEASIIIVNFVKQAFKLSVETAARYVGVAFGAVHGDSAEPMSDEEYWQGVRALSAVLDEITVEASAASL